MKIRIIEQEKKLDALFKMVEGIADEEVKATLSKFLCVRTSGFIETALKNLIIDYVDGTSPQAVQKYINKKIKAATNLKFERLAEILASFEESWQSEFVRLITEEQKAALNSIVSNRNNIAHGEGDSISFRSMKNYYTQAKDVVEILKTVIKK